MRKPSHDLPNSNDASQALHRDQFQPDLDEELRLHLDLREQKQRPASPSEARRAAHRQFGNHPHQGEKS